MPEDDSQHCERYVGELNDWPGRKKAVRQFRVARAAFAAVFLGVGFWLLTRFDRSGWPLFLGWLFVVVAVMNIFDVISGPFIIRGKRRRAGDDRIRRSHDS